MATAKSRAREHEQVLKTSGHRTRRPIEEIKVLGRYRRELGDLQPLAASIKEVGLLQPIGVTMGNVLVFGERRLAACKLLGWREVDVHIVGEAPTSDAAASRSLQCEHDENELRKDFAPSERAAIIEAMGRRPEGRPRKNSAPGPSLDEAAKAAGFDSINTAKRAIKVVREGVPELVDAMDNGSIPIRAAAEIAAKPPAEQRAELAQRRKPETPSTLRTPAGQVRSVAISSFAKLLHSRLTDTLEDLSHILADEQSRISVVSFEKRVALARAYLTALSISSNDLRELTRE